MFNQNKPKMKKFYVIFALLLTSSIAFSQVLNDMVVIGKKSPIPSCMMEKAATDTCGFSSNFIPEFAVGGTAYRMQFGNETWTAGWVFGTNLYPTITTVAQGYTNGGYIGIEGALLMFCGKEQVDPAAVLTVRAYSLNATAKNEPANTTGPGTVLGTTTITMADIDTTDMAFSVAMFTSPLPANGDFAVGVDFSALGAVYDTLATPCLTAGNEAGLFCDYPGDASGIGAEGNQLDYAFHKYGTSWWVSDYLFGGLDVNVAIFPIVDINYAGLNEDSYFYGMQSNAYPIPASENMTIEYALENSSDVTIEIFSGNGQIVAEFNQGNQAQGQYSFQVNVSDFNAGHYFFSIKANGHRLIKSFIVE